MNCVICSQNPGVEVPVTATQVVFGLSLCSFDTDRVVPLIIHGYSVNDILRDARSGHW